MNAQLRIIATDQPDMWSVWAGEDYVGLIAEYAGPIWRAYGVAAALDFGIVPTEADFPTSDEAIGWLSEGAGLSELIPTPTGAIDDTVELWPWRHKTSDVRISAGYGEVTLLGASWYASTVVQGSAHSLGVYRTEDEAKRAVQQALLELAADA